MSLIENITNDVYMAAFDRVGYSKPDSHFVSRDNLQPMDPQYRVLLLRGIIPPQVMNVADKTYRDLDPKELNSWKYQLGLAKAACGYTGNL